MCLHFAPDTANPHTSMRTAPKSRAQVVDVAASLYGGGPPTGLCEALDCLHPYNLDYPNTVSDPELILTLRFQTAQKPTCYTYLGVKSTLSHRMLFFGVWC